MLQHWASEREFYIGGFVNSLSRLLCVLRIYICIVQYNTGQIFRYTEKHLEHLWHDVRPETYIYVYIYMNLEKSCAIEQTRKLASLAIITFDT